jgi:transposase
MRDNEFTKILGWPGYCVYRHEIDEAAKTLRLWVRRKRGNRKLICSGCGRKFREAHDYSEREVRDLPWGEYRTTVIIEVYRVPLSAPQCTPGIPQVSSHSALYTSQRPRLSGCSTGLRFGCNHAKIPEDSFTLHPSERDSQLNCSQRG